MNEASYAVIRYMPDPGRGENLNIGIVVWAKESEEYRLSFDQKAIDRIVKWNPHLDRDALRYIEPMLHERLSSAFASSNMRILELLEHGGGFPLNFTEPRYTTISDEENGLDLTLERLVNRVVRPKQRYAPTATQPIDQVEKLLRPLLSAGKVERDYALRATGTGVPRSVDFFANSGANVALDVIKLAYKESARIRQAADAEANKVSDVLSGAAAVNKYFVLCQLHSEPEFEESNEQARAIIENRGANMLTDIDEAAERLEDAAESVA